jgi:cobalt transporter subunit CbtB
MTDLKQHLIVAPTDAITDTRISDVLAALATGLAGIALLWAVGFAEIDLLHNAAHDTRHSNVFPCH